MKVILILIIMAGLITTYFNSFGTQAELGSIIETLHTSTALIPYVGELSEMRVLVNDFLDLRESRNSPDIKVKAMELDGKINNLELVRKYCNQKISTLELAFENDPHAKLQQICPALKKVSFSRATQLFGQL